MSVEREPTTSREVWIRSHPAAAAVLQGIVFGILFGLVMALTGKQHPIGTDVLIGLAAGVVFGMAMLAVRVARLRGERG